MNKLEIKLKQHTPLIHFQHDQEGATLRASEVKPKLDKFFFAQLGKESYDVISDDEFDEVASIFERENVGKEFNDLTESQQEFEIGKYLGRKKGCLIGRGDHTALDYKMRIVIDSNSVRTDFLLASYLKQDVIIDFTNNGIISVSNTPYFAQEKENGLLANSYNKLQEWNKIGKKGVLESGVVKITITCFNENASNFIINKLSKYVQAFFLTTNFGTRQSKGFGCFSVVEMKLDNGHPLQLVDNIDLLKNNYSFVYKKTINENGSKRINTIFSTINNDYKLLKSGRIRPKPYEKSQIMLYADKNGIGWDKKYIKSKIDATFDKQRGQKYLLKCEPQNKKDIYADRSDYKYFRAMLGLAEQFEFQLDNPPENKSSNKLVVRVSHQEIKRFQSPLLFKVIGNEIFLVGNSVLSEMLDVKFDLSVTVQGDPSLRNVQIDGIKTPQKFSLINFMRFAMQNSNMNYEKIK